MSKHQSSRFKRNHWYRPSDRLPRDEEAIIACYLQEYANAAWEWFFVKCVFKTINGSGCYWERYGEPTYWMVPKMPEIPNNKAHRKAKIISKLLRKFSRQRKRLDKEEARIWEL